MVDAGNGPDEAALAVAARHALHDEELVAAFAAGGLEDEAETERARGLIERCAACRDLHHDLEAIGTAIREGAAFTAAAPRDFRLSVEDARRLGGVVSARGFLAGLRRSMASFARPVGASMATLGLVGILVGSTSLLGGATSSSLSVDSTGAGATSAPAELGPAAGQAASPDASERISAFEPGSSGVGKTDEETPRDNSLRHSGPSPVVWLLGGSVVLLLAGLVLLLVAFRRGRRGGVPGR